MTLVRFRYLKEQGIFNDRVALARAIDHYGFPKPIALGANTIAWDLEKEVEPWLASRPRRTPKCTASTAPSGRRPRKRPSAIVEDVESAKLQSRQIGARSRTRSSMVKNG